MSAPIMDEIREQLGVFPLPDVVLFPDALLPLHVLAPPERALLRDALARRRLLVVAVQKEVPQPTAGGPPEVYRTACTGEIVEHELLPDGCLEVILQGKQVVQIREFLSEEPYRTARVRVCPECACFAKGPAAAARLRELHQLLEEVCPGSLRALRARMKADLYAKGGLALLHTIAMHLPVEIPRKLEWLACPGSLMRWRAIRATLRQMARERTRREGAIRLYADLHPRNPARN